MARSQLLSTCGLVGLCLTPAGAVTRRWDQDTTPNRTHWRERDNRIVSVYGDVRRPLVGTRAAYPYPRNVFSFDVLVAYQRFVTGQDSLFQRALSEVLSAPIAAEEGAQSSRVDGRVTLTYHSPWRMLAIENDWSVSQSSTGYDEDKISFGDPTVRTVWTLAQYRYWAVAVTAGGSTGIHDGQDPLLNHGPFTAKLGLRSSGALGLFALTADVEVSFAPNAEFATGDPVDGVIEHEYWGLESSLSVTWRPWTWFRFGLIQRYDYHDWEADAVLGMRRLNDIIRLRPTLVTTEFTPGDHWHLSAALGMDFWADPDLLPGSGFDDRFDHTFTCRFGVTKIY